MHAQRLSYTALVRRPAACLKSLRASRSPGYGHIALSWACLPMVTWCLMAEKRHDRPAPLQPTPAAGTCMVCAAAHLLDGFPVSMLMRVRLKLHDACNEPQPTACFILVALPHNVCRL